MRPAAQEDEDKQISFKLVGEKIKGLEKPYIKTSAAATIIHIKKFLAKKLELQNHDQVDILCNNKLMGEESTLDFIESGMLPRLSGRRHSRTTQPRRAALVLWRYVPARVARRPSTPPRVEVGSRAHSMITNILKPV